MVGWIDRHFRRCIVLIPDSVYRLSLQISHDIDETAARTVAAQMAEQFISDAGRAAALKTAQCHLQVLRSSEIAERADYGDFLSALRNMCESSDTFGASVDSFCQAFLSRRQALHTDVPLHDRWRALSRDFVLEELAVAACLVADGYGVSIYPGSIEIFHEISAGLHPGLPAPLLKLVNVGIQFKRRTAAAL